MLRFAEEVILLLLRDHDGRFVRVPSWSIEHALAGGVLMDLALENRIDTDLDNLVLVDSTPVDDSLLDPTLAAIAEESVNTTRHWVERTVGRAEMLQNTALTRLVERGILERQDKVFLWAFRSRRYPMVDGRAEREVKLRIMEVLFGEEIPHPRDIMLICLADACGIFNHLLSREELGKAADRIAAVRQMDLIGQAMAQALRDIELSIAASVQPHMF